MQYYLKNILSLVIIFFCINIKNVHANKINTIAVLDFHSYNIDEKYAKIIRNDLEYHLYQSKDLRVLEREKIYIVINENKIKDIGSNKRDVLVSLGKTLSADYILAGDLQKDEKENKILINLRIINIVDGTVLYFYPGNIKDVSEIKNFTKSISDKIINDLIYFNTFGKTRSEEKTAEYPSIVERKDNKKNKTKNVNIAIFPEYIYPLGSFGNIVEKGYGIGIYGGLENFPFKNFNTGIEIGINKLDRKNNQSCYFIEIPLLLKINYLYNIFNFFYVAPEFKVGPVFFYYQSNKNTTSKDYNKYAIEIMSQAGIVLGKKINDNINISINVGYGIIFEEESLLNFLSFSIAIGYRF